MKELMKTNCYDIDKNDIAIVGSCLSSVQPFAFEKVKELSKNIFEVCLEAEHINMVITKLVGMLSRVEVEKVYFVTVDKSPHCTQLHYIEHEIKKAMPHINTKFFHYVAVENDLVFVENDVVELSKNLSKLQKRKDNGDL